MIMTAVWCDHSSGRTLRISEGQVWEVMMRVSGALAHNNTGTLVSNSTHHAAQMPAARRMADGKR